MDFIDKVSYQKLSREVGINDDIQSALKEGYELLGKSQIMEGVKGTPLEKKFEKEYKDLYEAIKKAIENDRQISIDERVKIMLELGDIVKLANDNGVEEKKGVLSWVGDILKGTDTKSAKDKAINFRKKKFDDYSFEEAIMAMNHLSENYNDYRKVGESLYNAVNGDRNDLNEYVTKIGISIMDSASKQFTLEYSSIDDLDDQYEVRLFQDKLRDKIFGKGNGFTNDYLLGFNNEKGNFVLKVSDFEKDLKSKDIKDINSSALSNYFLNLDKKGELNFEKLAKTFGNSNLMKLQTIWANEKGSDIEEKAKTPAKDKLVKLNIFNQINRLINTFSSPEEVMKILMNFDEKKVLSIEEKKQREVIAIFVNNNIDGIKEKMKNNLVKKFLANNPKKTKEEALGIVEKMMNDLEACEKGPKGVPKLLSIFESYNKDFNIGINILEETKKVTLVAKAKNEGENIEIRDEQTKYTELLAKGNEEERLLAVRILEELKLKKEIKEAELRDNKMAISILNTMNTEIAKDIAVGKKDYEKYIQELTQKDENFKREYEKYLEEEKKFKEKHPNLNNKENNQTEKQDGGNNSQSTSESSVFNIPYETNYSSYTVTITDGNEKIELSMREFDKLKNNKENLKSVIEFHKELKELGLMFVWNYRDFFTKTIFSFDIQNGITENELLKLYNFIGAQIGKNWKNLNEAQRDLGKLNSGKGKDINSYIKGDDLTQPESQIDSIYKGVLFTYLIKNEYFVNGDLIESKWNKKD